MANLNTFVNTVVNFKGLNSSVITELTLLAPKLSDTERDRILDELLILNNQLLQSKKIIMRLYQKFILILKSIKRKYIPRIRKVQEKNEHDAEINKVEKYFE